MVDQPLGPRLEIRFSVNNQAGYEARVVRWEGGSYGGPAPMIDETQWRPWCEGLLAVSLFDIRVDGYLGLAAGLNVLALLQYHTVSLLIAELHDQVELSQLFKRAEQADQE